MDEKITKSHSIKLAIISPVHIGTGSEYYPNEYFGDNKNHVNVFNLDLFIKKYPEEAERTIVAETKPLWQLTRSIQSFSMGEDLIKNRDFIDSQTLKELKEGLEKGKIATILEFNKNHRFEPYIPGSSLKGMFRTAVAYAILKKSPQMYEKVKRGLIKKVRNEKINKILTIPGNSDIIEELIFRSGEDGKNDLMRLWSFTDSKPLNKDNTLTVIQTRRLSRNRILGIRNYYEVLYPKSPMIELQISFLSALAQNYFFDREVFSLFPKTLNDLFDSLNLFVDDVIDWELNYFSNHNCKTELKDLVKFYEVLKSYRKSGRTLITLGKGTGWIRKSIGLLFKKDRSTIFHDIFYAYTLGRKGQRAEIFPSSREIIISEGEKKIFGWAEIKV